MTDVITLAAESRGRIGKGGAREARRQGRIPAIVYGNMHDPLAISVDDRELRKLLRRPGFMNHVFELDLQGRKMRVLPREVQQDPVSDAPLHVDFMQVSATTELTVSVELRFVNEDKAPGLKRGGVLNIVQHALQVVCRPDAIPDVIEIDLSGLEIGDVIHQNGVALPAGVSLADTGSDATIASIATPTQAEPVAEPEPTEPAS